MSTYLLIAVLIWLALLAVILVSLELRARNEERNRKLAQINADDVPVLNAYRDEVAERKTRAFLAAANSRARRTQFDIDHGNRERLGR